MSDSNDLQHTVTRSSMGGVTLNLTNKITSAAPVIGNIYINITTKEQRTVARILRDDSGFAVIFSSDDVYKMTLDNEWTAWANSGEVVNCPHPNLKFPSKDSSSKSA